MARWVELVTVPTDPIPDGKIAFSKDVGFQAKSIAIDNLTGYWLYLPEAQSFIPPWWIGVVRNPVHSTDYSYVQWKSPFGGAQTTPIPGIGANPGFTILLTDYYVPYNSGSLLPGAPGSGPGPLPVIVTNPCCDMDAGYCEPNNDVTFASGDTVTLTLPQVTTSPPTNSGTNDIDLIRIRGIQRFLRIADRITFDRAGFYEISVLVDGVGVASSNATINLHFIFAGGMTWSEETTIPVGINTVIAQAVTWGVWVEAGTTLRFDLVNHTNDDATVGFDNVQVALLVPG